MKSITPTKVYMYAVVLAGAAAVSAAFWTMQVDRVSMYFVVLACFTIGVGPRMTVQIPRFKSHIAVSNAFVFLAILIFGGELAVVLAGVEAYFASRRFCSKRFTALFNAAALALSTGAVVVVLRALGLYQESALHGHRGAEQDFVIALSVIAMTQFGTNTLLCALHDSIKHRASLANIWKEKYLWSFVTYFVGAAAAGMLVQVADYVGFGILLAVLPVIYLVFLSYRMYLSNVEISMQQAEQAKQHAKILEERGAELRDSEHRFRSAFNYAPIGIALVSPIGSWLKVNRALTDILGYSGDEFLASNFQSMMVPEDMGPALVKINQLLSGKTANAQMEQRYVHKNGHTVWISWSGSIASDASSEHTTLIFQLHDITDKKLAEERLQHEATHDALTGLPNRAYFLRRLADALQKYRENPKYNVSVLFIDLDRFKYVNDSLGHLVGDRLLIEIARRLNECMRPPDMVARLGGDEFVILVEGRYYTEKVTRVAERIQNKFTKPFEINGHEIYSSASIGILYASEKHRTSEDMMRDADTAMYHAKRAGKGRHEVFDEKMHRAAKETLQLETELRRAIDRRELNVLYQPIFSLESGRVVGAEALMRWKHRELGDIGPDRFIALAEELHLIDQLGQLALETACRDIGSIDGLLEAHPEFRVGVNLSCRQFVGLDLVDKIIGTLETTEFSARNLRLEITESVVFEHQDRAVEMLHQLRHLGIEIDIDDFGTGYSNLSYLTRLPVSSLKIDQSFVRAVGEDGSGTEIIETIVSMARSLGLTVVAEGVETKTQLSVLKRLGCDRAQGFLLARPMTREKLAELMSENDRLVLPETLFDISTVSVIQ